MNRNRSIIASVETPEIPHPSERRELVERGLDALTLAETAMCPMVGHDARQSMFFPQAVSRNRGKLKWQYAVPGMTSPMVVGADGTIYFGADDGCLRAVSPDSVLKWQYQAPRGLAVVHPSPVIASDGTIYFASLDGFLHALQPNGIPKWRHRMDCGPILCDPVIAPDDSMYVIGLGDGCLYTLWPGGSVKWRFQVRCTIGLYPSIALDGSICIVSADGYLYSLHSDGTMAWRIETGNPWWIGSPAISTDGTVYAILSRNQVCALGVGGELKWKVGLGREDAVGVATASDGTIYASTLMGDVYALRADGIVKWMREGELPTGGDDEGGGPVSRAPCVAGDGTTYVIGYFGRVSALTPEGKAKWNVTLPGYPCHSRGVRSLAIARDGTVYASLGDGVLHAIG